MKAQGALEDSLLKSRVQDAIRLCRNSYVPQFLGFLDERQKTLTEIYIRQEHMQAQTCYWGGYPDACRTILGIFPEYYEYGMDDFSIIPLEALYTARESLNHRDFLGSLMGLGIKREVVGDILVEEGRCVVFVSSGISEYICSQWNKAGKLSIKCSVPYELKIPQSSGFLEISGTIASARLDCAVAGILKISRSSAVDLIVQRHINLDFLECTDVSKCIASGQTLSAQGYGKYKIDEIGPMTKKGRLILRARKYL